MAFKAFTWIKTNLCGCVCKKEQPKLDDYEDLIIEPSTSGYLHTDFPDFVEKKDHGKYAGKSMASGDYLANGKKRKRKFQRRRFKCKVCAYKSTSKKGLRCHLTTVHKKDVQPKRTTDAYGRPLNFFGDIIENDKMCVNEQKLPVEIYDGDDDFDKQMEWAINDSVAMAAQRGHFDSDTDTDDDETIKYVTSQMIQNMKMRPLKIG